MSNVKPQDQVENLEEQLEEGLEDSFPASDPPSVARRHRAPPARGGDADGEDQ
jgi:hypothetical protein